MAAKFQAGDIAVFTFVDPAGQRFDFEVEILGGPVASVSRGRVYHALFIGWYWNGRREWFVPESHLHHQAPGDQPSTWSQGVWVPKGVRVS